MLRKSNVREYTSCTMCSANDVSCDICGYIFYGDDIIYCDDVPVYEKGHDEFSTGYHYCSKCNIKVKLQKELDKYTIKETTHKLRCKHKIGKYTRVYYMDCIILKKLQNNRLKLLVFGNRYFKNTDRIKRIRYVDDDYRVTLIKSNKNP